MHGHARELPTGARADLAFPGSASGLPRILYIMGMARSGTTILQILLGAAPGVCSAGELSHIVRDGFLEDRPCACGEPASACPFWSRVRAGLKAPRWVMEEKARLVRSVDWHRGFPRLALGRIPGSRMRAYCDLQHALFGEIARAAGADTRVVVDDSIYPGRALALSRCFPDRLSVICLVRNPAGLQSAFSKPNRDEQLGKSAAGATAYYTWVAASLWATLRLLKVPVLRLTFEELRSDPVGTMERIQAWSGIDLVEVRRRLREDLEFDVGHVVTGNRLRQAGTVRFRRGVSGHQLPPTRRAGAWLMDIPRRLFGL